jgi:di/tricarboxylate transporter
MMASLFAASRFVGSHHSLQRSENVRIAAMVPRFNSECVGLPGAPLAAAIGFAISAAFFFLSHLAYSVN